MYMPYMTYIYILRHTYRIQPSKRCHKHRVNSPEIIHIDENISGN